MDRDAAALVYGADRSAARDRAHRRVRRRRGDAHRGVGEVPPRRGGARTGRRRVRDALVVDGYGGSVRPVPVGASTAGAVGLAPRAEALVQADGHGVAGLLADDLADLGLDRKLV